MDFVPEGVVGAGWTVPRLSPRLLLHYDFRISLDELSPLPAIASFASSRVLPLLALTYDVRPADVAPFVVWFLTICHLFAYFKAAVATLVEACRISLGSMES